MMTTAFDVITGLQGRTVGTAESLTGGMIGAALTDVPGASRVFKGGIVSYTDQVKREVLGVAQEDLLRYGAVSAPVAAAMARGARQLLKADVVVSVTGLAGPDADDFGHAVGTVFIGYADAQQVNVKEYHFSGDRQQIRRQTVEAALARILEQGDCYVE